MGSSSRPGSYDGTARTWEVATGRPLVTFAGHDGAVYAVAFSPDGTRIATASSDQTARVWDAASGATVVTRAGHFEAVQDVTFSPDGTRLATASTLSGLVWDAVTGQWIASFNGHADIVTSVAFSPDGTLVFGGASTRRHGSGRRPRAGKGWCLQSTAERMRMPPSFRTGP